MNVVATARRRYHDHDTLNLIRRRTAMVIDNGVARLQQRITPPRSVAYDGETRLALITVNFSTTRWLKLMLLTLSEQQDLEIIERVIVVDNGSRDGGVRFLRNLAARTPAVHVVERRRLLHHATAMRAGVRALDRLDGGGRGVANTLLFCDPDVIFLRRDALAAVAGSFEAHDAVLVGEVRRIGRPGPDIQASFLAVRRDVNSRRDIVPLVHDGSPASRQQLSIEQAGLTIVDLPTNHGGLILHRGRSGVAATRIHRPRHPYATAHHQAPHFMGVPDGEATWAAVEATHAELLGAEHEDELLGLLSQRFTGLGATVTGSLLP